jgi:hypothetical protein
MHEKLQEHSDAYNVYRSAKAIQPGNSKALEGIQRLIPILDEKGLKYHAD